MYSAVLTDFMGSPVLLLALIHVMTENVIVLMGIVRSVQSRSKTGQISAEMQVMLASMTMCFGGNRWHARTRVASARGTNIRHQFYVLLNTFKFSRHGVTCDSSCVHMHILSWCFKLV